ncbi:hypothetical protein [Pedobacter sp. UC225_65]|uniref:hypothetical protein n=1 Tax=Pedobacter sp. UC225_65 TaxID=3350173 RepID=UPI00366B7E84
MKNNSLTPPHQSSKWLLTLLLCLGFFVFSGGVSNVQPGQHRAVQTESVIGTAQKHNNRLVHYHYRVNSDGQNDLINTPAFGNIVLVHYHRALQTKFKLLRQQYVNQNTKQFFPLKTIPQDSKESTLSFLLG